MWARRYCSLRCLCLLGSGGFEPPKLTHLVYSQAQLSTLATALVHALARVLSSGADDGTRTRNLLFTKQLLCQLSYVGIGAKAAARPTGSISMVAAGGKSKRGQRCQAFFHSARLDRS